MTTLAALADFILDCWDQAVRMRADGVPMVEIQRGLAATVIDGARARGLVTADRDLPPWFLKKCQACQDSGWEPTTRLVRGEVVEAFKRCPCQAARLQEPSDDREVAAKVSAGWKRIGR